MVGQHQSLKDRLLEFWALVSWDQKKSDGYKVQRYGANPTGIAFFDAGGRYIITVMRSDRANYASNALWQGTAEENEATASGTITYFGTYSVIEADSSSPFTSKAAPSRIGMVLQKRIVSIAGDQSTLTIRPPIGETVNDAAMSTFDPNLPK